MTRYRCTCKSTCYKIYEIEESTKIRAEIKAETRFLDEPCYPEEVGAECQCVPL